MYTKNDLRDINNERAEIICDAITELKKNVVPGRPYTARELSEMTGRMIPTSNFEGCLRRGYRIIEKRVMMNPANYSYYLFGDWRAKCVIHREGTRLITIKEYDEDGNLINERKIRRGRPYYTASF